MKPQLWVNILLNYVYALSNTDLSAAPKKSHDSVFINRVMPVIRVRLIMSFITRVVIFVQQIPSANVMMPDFFQITV